MPPRPAEHCEECGCIDWLVSLVDDRGVRRCLNCLNGRPRPTSSMEALSQ